MICQSEIDSTVIRLKIEKVVFGGYGLGYLEGVSYFVFNALPGDIIDVKILYKKKNAFFCEIEKIISPSEYRTNIKCELNGKCGACDWVNISYPHQIELKQAIYREIFPDNPDIIESPQIDFYRNKCTFPVQEDEGHIKIGMYERQSHNVIEHQSCYLYPKIYKEILLSIKEWMKNSHIKPYDEQSNMGEVRFIVIRSSADLKSILMILITKKRKLGFTKQLVHLLTDKFPEIKGIIQNIQPLPNNVNIGEDDKILYGESYLHENLDNLSLKIHYKAFFQVNITQTLQIYNEIQNHLNAHEVAIDAYSGIGSIGLFIANKIKKVICIEENKEAVESGKVNAQNNNIPNIVFMNDTVENVLTDIISRTDIDTIIFDPPRKGLDKSIIESINIPKIIYLSCNPVTQKRDIKLLMAKGYELIFLKGYDMFPHTWHIESLAVLTN